MKDNNLSKWEIISLFAGLIALIILQLMFRREPFYDEDDYLANVAVLHQYGFGKNYLTHLAGSAGPLYSMVHFLLEPLTGLKPPYVRLVNTGFLLGSTYFTYLTLCLLDFPKRWYSLYVMAIPMTYIIAGLALTEMPAIFFFSAFIYLIIKSTGINPGTKKSLLILLVAGVCMSLAILGRQPFLLTLAAIPVLFISRKNYTKNILPLAVILFSSVALPLYVFSVWKGLVPTIESQLYKDIANAGSSYRPDFVLMCVFYFSVSLLLISPGFYKLPRSRNTTLLWGIFGIAVIAFNLKFGWLELLPVKPILVKVFTAPGQFYLFSMLFGGLVIFLSIYFLTLLYTNIQTLHYPRELVFFVAALLLVALACIKITWGFSSRYAAQAVPLLVLIGSYTYRNAKYNIPGILFGVLTGLLSLITYFTGI